MSKGAKKQLAECQRLEFEAIQRQCEDDSMSQAVATVYRVIAGNTRVKIAERFKRPAIA